MNNLRMYHPFSACILVIIALLVFDFRLPSRSGCNKELVTGINQRIEPTLLVCKALRDIVKPMEPSILAGDFNDDYHPLRILNEEMGLMDVFESLDISAPHTHPVRPSDFEEEMKPNR